MFLPKTGKKTLTLPIENSSILGIGEDVTFYEKGKVVNHAGSWKAYENGNRPGLIMPGDPKVGMKYYQELAPDIAMDRAEIISISETIKTPYGELKHCVKTKESSPIDPVEEYKIYAPGIGLVQDQDMKLIRYGYIKGTTSQK